MGKAEENEVLDVAGVIDAATNKPSTIKLTTFALYEVSGSGSKPQIKCHAGASHARVGDDGVIELLASSVPFKSDTFTGKAPKSGKGMLMLYGIHDTLDELARMSTIARSQGLRLAKAEVEVNIGYMEPKLVSRAMLKAYGPHMRFGNLRRMVATLQTDIAEAFVKYAKKEDLEISNRVSEIAKYPHLFDRLFDEDEDMAHLSVISIPLLDDPKFTGKMRQVAYVRPDAQVVSIRQGATDARILLPNWMTNVAVEQDATAA